MHQASIAVIGAGFTGTALALHLARRGASVHLLDPAVPGPGLAYGTTEPAHLLNVPAKSMSLWPDQPSHFLDWVRALPELDLGPLCDGIGPDAFLPRHLFGRYLGEALAAQPDIQRHRADVTDILPVENGYELAPLGLRASAVALCLGNPPPRQGPPTPGVVNDPWATGALDGLAPHDPVLLLGTGLTMADTVLTLRLRHGHRGVIHAASRHGWAPLPHAAPLPTPREVPNLPTSHGVCAMMRTLRKATREAPWQAGVDGFRPQLQAAWRALDAAQRGRFLRHGRTAWNLHRHRVAPSVAAFLAREVTAGRLVFHAGRLHGFTQGEALLRPRGYAGTRAIPAERLIHCTGPDIGADTPLVRALLARGLLRQDAHRLGLEVEPETLAAAPGLHVLGPATRATLWEATAVPELRAQAARVAELLAG